MAKIKFDNNTDYDNVERITRLIRGDVVARDGDCCHSVATANSLCATASNLSAAVDAKDAAQQDRYKNAVKMAYLSIYPLADKDYNP